jgi:hypothetical protein
VFCVRQRKLVNNVDDDDDDDGTDEAIALNGAETNTTTNDDDDDDAVAVDDGWTTVNGKRTRRAPVRGGHGSVELMLGAQGSEQVSLCLRTLMCT